MVEIVIFIVVVIMVLMGGIIVFSHISGTSVEENTKKLKNGIVAVYKTFVNAETTPLMQVRLGSLDGVSFNLTYINETFKEVIKLFDVCYFLRHQERESNIVYFFKAVGSVCVNDLVKMYELIQEIVQLEVQKVLHDNEYNISVDNFVAVQYKNNILQIVVAKDYRGAPFIENLRAKANAEIFQDLEQDVRPMETDWDEQQ